MELALCLGEPPARSPAKNGKLSTKLKLGFCMELGIGRDRGREEDEEEVIRGKGDFEVDGRGMRHVDSSVQLCLLPLVPPTPKEMVFPWATKNSHLEESNRGFDVNQVFSAEEAAVISSSPNSSVSSPYPDFSVSDPPATADIERASSRASDEDDNGGSRKKLRLSKEQSAFLEESFKEHNTLNPKQKLALAKQLNLHTRQVEVWFQNRRARTKLKQTEVDCEYLKRCCDTLKDENRRLKKELCELRALKASQSFYMQLPATTLSMCPSCERVSNTAANRTSTDGYSGDKKPPASSDKSIGPGPFIASLFPKSRIYPFSHLPSGSS